MNNEVAVRESVRAEISGFEMRPRSMDEAMKFCDLMAKSELVPKCYQDKPGNIMVAIQMGSELGLSPMRALRSIAVINGRASMWGDDVLAMVQASSVCEYVDESASTDKQGVCKTKRKGCTEQMSVFTLDDAKRAGLLGKQGPWQTHTKRMLMLRARGFGLRDTFADVLAGLVTAEEALDMPRIEPDDPATNILEANQPLSLKDKLKAKVEAVEDKAAAEPITSGSPHIHTVDFAQDAPASLLPEYLDQIGLSQSVAECSKTLNTALKDASLTVFETTQLNEAGKKKILELRAKK